MLYRIGDVLQLEFPKFRDFLEDGRMLIANLISQDPY